MCRARWHAGLAAALDGIGEIDADVLEECLPNVFGADRYIFEKAERSRRQYENAGNNGFEYADGRSRPLRRALQYTWRFGGWAWVLGDIGPPGVSRFRRCNRRSATNTFGVAGATEG